MIDQIPHDVQVILDQARSQHQAVLDKEQADRDAEEAAELTRQQELIETTSALFVPEPLRPYLRFNSDSAYRQYYDLLVPGLAPILLMVDLRDDQEAWGVRSFSGWYDGDDLHYYDRYYATFEEALFQAQTLPSREAALARAQKSNQERESYSRHNDISAVDSLMGLATGPEGPESFQTAALLAIAHALRSIALSLQNMEPR